MLANFGIGTLVAVCTALLAAVAQPAAAQDCKDMRKINVGVDAVLGEEAKGARDERGGVDHVGRSHRHADGELAQLAIAGG